MTASMPQQHHPGVYARITQTASHDQPFTSFASTAVYATLPPRGASLSGVQGSPGMVCSHIGNNNTSTTSSNSNLSAMTRSNSHDLLTMTQQQPRREVYGQYGHPIPQYSSQQPVRVGSQQQINYYGNQQQLSYHGYQQPQHHMSSAPLVNVSPNSMHHNHSNNGFASNVGNAPSGSVQHYSPPPNPSYVHYKQHVLQQQNPHVVQPLVNVPINGFNNSNNHLNNQGYSNNHISRSAFGTSNRPYTLYHPSSSSSHTQHINGNNQSNAFVHAVVQAPPDIPSSASIGQIASSLGLADPSTDSIKQQTSSTFGRSSRTSPNTSSLPGYTSLTNVPVVGAASAVLGNNNNGQSRSGLQQQYCPPSAQTSSSLASSQNSLTQHSMTPVVGHHHQQQQLPLMTHASTTGGKRVRALYHCIGENPAELTFESNAIIYDGE